MKQRFKQYAAMLAALVLASGTGLGFPTNISSKTVNIDHNAHDFNDFGFTWRGYEDQEVRFVIKDDDGGVNMNGFFALFKASKRVSGGTNVAFIVQTTTNITVSTSNITFSVAKTSVPPDDTYRCELLLLDTATSNIVRSLARGKVRVEESLFDDVDGTWQNPVWTNLTDYLTKVEAGATYLAIAGTNNYVAATNQNWIDLTNAYTIADAVVNTALIASTNANYDVLTNLYITADAALLATMVAATNNNWDLMTNLATIVAVAATNYTDSATNANYDVLTNLYITADGVVNAALIASTNANYDYLTNFVIVADAAGSNYTIAVRSALIASNLAQHVSIQAAHTTNAAQRVADLAILATQATHTVVDNTLLTTGALHWVSILAAHTTNAAQKVQLAAISNYTANATGDFSKVFYTNHTGNVQLTGQMYLKGDLVVSQATANIVLGLTSASTGQFAMAQGAAAKAHGFASFASGRDVSAMAESSHALGRECGSSNQYSFTAGYKCYATNNSAFVFGDGSALTYSDANNQFATRFTGGYKLLGGNLSLNGTNIISEIVSWLSNSNSITVNSSRGAAAYLWGNHASAGYLRLTTNQMAELMIRNPAHTNAEMTTNGNFYSGSDGWALTNWTYISSGSQTNQIQLPAGSYGRLAPSNLLTIVKGRVYRVKLQQYGFGDVVTNWISLGGYTNRLISTITQTNTLYFGARNNNNLDILTSNGPNYAIRMKWISVNEISDGELWAANSYVGHDLYVGSTNVMAAISGSATDITALETSILAAHTTNAAQAVSIAAGAASNLVQQTSVDALLVTGGLYRTSIQAAHTTNAAQYVSIQAAHTTNAAQTADIAAVSNLLAQWYTLGPVQNPTNGTRYFMMNPLPADCNVTELRLLGGPQTGEVDIITAYWTNQLYSFNTVMGELAFGPTGNVWTTGLVLTNNYRIGITLEDITDFNWTNQVTIYMKLTPQ